MTHEHTTSRITRIAACLMLIMAMTMCSLAASAGTALAADSVSIPIRHTLINEPASEEPPESVSSDKFSFVLTRVTPGAPLPPDATGDSATITITGQGQGTFSQIEFTTPGRYEYTLRQEQGKRQKVTYDSREYTVVVTVPNSLIPTVTIKDPDGSKPDEAQFYTICRSDMDGDELHEPVTITFPGRGGLEKSIQGNGKYIDTDFSFTATPDDATKALGQDKVLIAKVDGEGKATFEPIYATRIGTYTYTIEEKAAHPGSWKYDKATFTYSFDVYEEEAEDGTITPIITDPIISLISDEIEESREQIAFTNIPTAKNKAGSVVRRLTQTGDPQQLMVLFAMFIGGALVITFILAPRRRRKS